MLKQLILAILISSSVFAMHNVELNINDEDVEVNLNLDIAQFNRNTEPESLFIGIKVLHPGEKYSNYYELNFLLQKELAKTGFWLGLGMKLNATDDFASIPLGVEISYRFLNNVLPIRLKASVNYAPKALTYLDAKSYIEYRAGIEIEVIKNANIIAGFRDMHINYAKPDINLKYNSSAFVGFKFHF